MSPDRNPQTPRRNRVDDVVVGKTSIRDTVKGNRKILPSIHFEPTEKTNISPERISDLEELTKSMSGSGKHRKNHRGRKYS